MATVELALLDSSYNFLLFFCDFLMHSDILFEITSPRCPSSPGVVNQNAPSGKNGPV